MSDSLLSFIIIFAQLGGVLLIVVLSWVICFLFNMKKEGKNTRELINHIKEVIPKHRDQLKNYFKNELELDEKKVDINVETLMDDEKKLYDHLIKVSVSKDMKLLKSTTTDLNSLINDYVRLLSVKLENEPDENKESRDIKLKKENEALRLEKNSLEKRLKSATETIENMMGEFSSMYEGGKKEGEQRVKNEMYKLQQSFKSEEVKSKSELSKLENSDKKENESKEK